MIITYIIINIKKLKREILGISLNNNRDSITCNVRTDAVYINVPGAAAVDIEIFAELTDIPSARFGTGWTGKGIDTNHGDAATKLLEVEA